MTGGTFYTFTFAARAAVTARTVTPKSPGYDSDSGADQHDDGGRDHRRVRVVDRRVHDGDRSPTAVYAAPIITWNTAAAAEVHYLDELAFYPGTVASSVNLLADDYASFEAGVTVWNAGFSSSTITVSSTRAQHGTKSVLATWGGGTGGNLAVANVAGLTIGRLHAQPLRVDRVRCRRHHRRSPLVGRRSSGPRGHGRVDLHDGGVGATRVHVHGDRDLPRPRDQRGRRQPHGPVLPRRLGAA